MAARCTIGVSWNVTQREVGPQGGCHSPGVTDPERLVLKFCIRVLLLEQAWKKRESRESLRTPGAALTALGDNSLPIILCSPSCSRMYQCPPGRLCPHHPISYASWDTHQAVCSVLSPSLQGGSVSRDQQSCEGSEAQSVMGNSRGNWDGSEAAQGRPHCSATPRGGGGSEVGKLASTPRLTAVG